MNAQSLATLVWSIAELLRGDYRQSDYGKVILPFTVLRRLDCVLEPTKAAVLAEHARVKAEDLPPEHFLLEKSQQSFFNSSPMDLGKLLGDPSNLRANIVSYVNGFSESVRDIFEKFEFEKQIERLDGANLLFLIVQKFASVDLHPNVVSNADMGHMFEELIRRFAELSNETAGEHFTPREVIRLMVNLLFIEDDKGLSVSGTVRSIYDPTAGTGGMLSVAEEHLLAMNPKAKLSMHGQELNPESYAICKADMLVKGQDVSNIVFGNTLSKDGHAGKKFDYMLSNPPFGVDWKKVEEVVRKEHESQGAKGRFGPGLPRVSDGSLLFLMHLVSKMRDPAMGGSRVGIVLNGSPLFTGGAGSGESEIRRFLFEHDLVEAIIGLPNDMFYNTGIGTYVWILTNKKTKARSGKVHLIDASSFWSKMRKSLGSKRKELSADDITRITKIYGCFAAANRTIVFDAEGNEVGRGIPEIGEDVPATPDGGWIEVVPLSKILSNKEFGYTTVTVERPLRAKFEITSRVLEEIRDLENSKKSAAATDIEGLKAVVKDIGIGTSWATKQEMTTSLAASYRRLGVEPTMWIRKHLAAATMVVTPDGEIQRDAKGKIEPNPELRSTENVPLTIRTEDYLRDEVLPYDADAWIDVAKNKVGYEVPFNRQFYVFRAPRPVAAINKELTLVGAKIISMIEQVAS